MKQLAENRMGDLINRALAAISIAASTAFGWLSCSVEATPLKEVPLEYGYNFESYSSILGGIGKNDPFRALTLYYFDKHSDLLEFLDVNSQSDFAKLFENNTFPKNYYIEALITTFPESLFDVHYLHNNSIINDADLDLFVITMISIMRNLNSATTQDMLLRLLASTIYYKNACAFLSVFFGGVEVCERLGVERPEYYKKFLFDLSLFADKNTPQSSTLTNILFEELKFTISHDSLVKKAKDAFRASIYSNIIYDEIEKLEQFIQSNELEEYTNKIIGAREIVFNPIDFAALFGAKQAFNKILVQSLSFNLENTNKTALFACIGGNSDIISSLFINYTDIRISEHDAIVLITDKDIVSYLYENNSIIPRDLNRKNILNSISTLDNLISLNKLIKIMPDNDMTKYSELLKEFYYKFTTYSVKDYFIFNFLYLTRPRLAKWPTDKEKIELLLSNGVDENFIDGLGKNLIILRENFL